MHVLKINAYAQIYVNLLNSVKQKFQYSVKLRLFDNWMHSSNWTVVTVLLLL